MRVACIVPCRAGSRRVPGKNLKPLHGKPLLSHVLEAAAAARCFEESGKGKGNGAGQGNGSIVGCGVFVVSDDPSALDLARSSAHNAGAIAIPASMAGADSPVLPVLTHAADAIGAQLGADLDAICYLRATSPFVRPQSVRRAVCELLASRRRRLDAPEDCFDSVLGVVPVTGAHPSRFKRIDPGTGQLLDAFPEFPEGRVPQRSETLRAFQRNSAVTACWMETLRGGSLWGDRAKAMVMDEIESVDINTPLEFEFAEFLSARRLIL
jgi:CMP-N,N'-diacetyllegionaminic acid synthase